MSKKEQLLLNAAKIIFEEGIQKLTIDYLAERSNITKAGVFYHFDDKASLLLQMNEMAITHFEDVLQKHMDEQSGPANFTRAYAYATIDFFENQESALLPAVFISSLEYEQNFNLWKKTSAKWDRFFLEDSGDAEKNLQLRLMCDGIWFTILYAPNHTLKSEMKQTILQLCYKIEKETD